MPIYEFDCRSCGENFTLKASVKEKEEGLNCPHCGSSDLGQVYKVTFFVKGGKSRTSACSQTSCSTCTSRTCPK